jgi:regulator of sigma E protease
MSFAILAFILTLHFLIFIHEFSHFLAAKKARILVEEFWIGFPPKILSFKIKETKYSLGLIPLGGFVELHGENKEIEDPLSFRKKTPGKRAKVVAAGPLGNLILATLLFSLLFLIGMPELKNEKEPGFLQIIEVKKDSPAMIAQIKPGDIVLKLQSEGEEISPKEIKDIQEFTNRNLGKKILVTLKRGEKIFEVEVLARKNPPKNEGPMGIALAKVNFVSYPFFQAIFEGIKYTFNLIYQFFKAFFKAFLNLILRKKVEGIDVVGPIGIYGFFLRAFSLGKNYLLQLIGFISLSVGLINLFPFPALDGGRLLLLSIEKIRKKPIKFQTEELINKIGFLILLILMIIILIRDIKNFL